MSQEYAILKRLERGDTITPIDALTDPEIKSLRLGARILELRRKGHDIETMMIRTPGGKSVAAYRLRRRVESNGQVVFA